jgi:EAL domain-containing protein (putative c-di-GMP-specific phosphodiesterase class I)
VQPADVVSIAEQSGLVNALTQWTFEEAVMQCSKWKKLGLELNVAINLSVCVLQDENIAFFIKDTLNKYQLSSENITLEITESAMMTNPVRVSDILKQLHEIGVSISADDFGTGFSSLSYLKTLPVNEIKIDKSFVMDMVRDSTDSAIVKSAIGLAHNLGLKVVAEGIENQGTQQALQELSCDIGQGYYFSEPLSASALMKWVKNHASEVSVAKV